MKEKLTALKKILGEVYDLNTALAALDWDQQVNMPTAGAAGRASQAATISRIAHGKFTDDTVGELLEELTVKTAGLNSDSNAFCLVKVAKREYQRQRKVPGEYVSEFAAAASVGHVEWEKAKAAGEFNLFKKPLQNIFDLRRQYAEFFAPYEHIYDPLLDEFEPAMKTAEVMDIFEKVRARQVELVHNISLKAETDTSFLHVNFDVERQWKLGLRAAAAIGYNFDHGRLDRAVHPFTTTFNLRDVRITTRVFRNNLSSLFSTLHEAGHAIYEQNISPALERSPLSAGCSLAVHESQSRLWENLVGRSKAFWRYFYPELQKHFPAQFKLIALDDFHKGINKVKPGFIRVDADEATYNLHIMLRLELEIAVLEQRLDVADLPEAWNAKMQEYLGVTPPNDGQGVLQDVHWAGGAIGYFPTYALGNMISVQLWDTAKKDIDNLEDLIAKGEFAPLREWLSEKVHRHGAKFNPQDLIRRVTGSGINPEPYLNYLNTKYGEIYSLTK